MINRVLGKFSKDVGIDLGTANTLVFVKGKGIVINEPSIVSVNTKTNRILAVGRTAKDMLGKTPPHIITTKPLNKGVVSDFEATEKMLRHFINKIHGENFSFLARPRIIIGVPLAITEVERKAVEDAALSAGAREVYLVEEPMLAAIGARLPITDSVGTMIVDIGGGTTEIAVISLSGIVTWRAMTIAGEEMNKQIINYAREHMNLLLGERVAEQIKIRIGSAIPQQEPLEMEMRGRDLITGLPKEIIVNDSQIRAALEKTIAVILENIKMVLEATPPELTADIFERGMVLMGGGSLLRGLDTLIAKHTAVPVRIADDPLTCVVRGAGLLLEDIDFLKEISLPLSSDSI